MAKAPAKAPKIEVDDKVRFKGYSSEVEDDDKLLEEGEIYTVVEVNAKEGSAAVEIDNPDFNPKKKESDDNSKTLIVDVFFEEFEKVEDDEDTGEEEEAPAKTKPKAKAETKPARGKAKADEEDEDETEEEEAPAKSKAKPAAKGKETSKTSTKGKADAKAKTKPKAKEEAEEVDKYGDLSEDQEDKAVLEMIEDAEDIVELAKEIVEENASTEYRLGGILFHLRRDKEYVKLDKRYAAKGSFGVPSGFQLFINEVLNLDYRKAMYLLDIYYNFSKYGIAAETVAEIGWTKASRIAAVMTEDNAEDLVELAKDSSVTELSESIKESYVDASNKSGKEIRRKIIFKYKLFEDQGKAVEEVLEAAAENLSMKPDDVFEHIVMEWAAENGISVKTKKAAKESKAATSDKATSKPKARK